MLNSCYDSLILQKQFHGIQVEIQGRLQPRGQTFLISRSKEKIPNQSMVDKANKRTKLIRQINEIREPWDKAV